MIIHPSILNGTVKAPPSKSSMQRACAAALLRKGVSILHNIGLSEDEKAAISIIQMLGADVQLSSHSMKVVSEGVKPFSNQLHCKESGLCVRMFTPIAALSFDEIIVTGAGSLLSRPMSFFGDIFPQLQIDIVSNRGKLPITLKGPLTPKNIKIDGSMSSQFLTGLLMAYAVCDLAHEVHISVDDLKSKPYIDLTLAILKKFSLNVPFHHNYETFIFQPYSHNSFSETIEYTVEGDWSGASFLLVAGAIAGNASVLGLDKDSVQADKSIIKALQMAGAILDVQKNKIDVTSSKLKAFDFDATDCPDLFPPLVALAANCVGATTIKGVHRLLHKESNRALTLQQEFEKMGVQIFLEDDSMKIIGSNMLGAKINSHGDHRIAMACSVAALRAGTSTFIDSPNVVNKSYPDFFTHLQQLGATIQV